MRHTTKTAFIIFATVIVTGMATADFAGGDGSLSNPYQISTCQQLQDIENDLDANYILINNLDCQSYSFNQIGDIFDDNPFNGTLDGNYKTISGYESSNGGLFDFVGAGGLIENLEMEEVNIDTGSPGNGVLVDNLEGNISQVSINGSITGGDDSTGGIAHGPFGRGFVKNSIFTGEVFGGLGTSGVAVGPNINNSISGAYVDNSYGGRYFSEDSRNGLFYNVDIDKNVISPTDKDGTTFLPTENLTGLSVPETANLSIQGSWIPKENDYPEPINLYYDGEGTSSDPYHIRTCQQLQNMNKDLDAHYELTQDIDCSSVDNWKSIGFESFDNVPGFAGSLNGRGHTISNLTDDELEFDGGLVQILNDTGVIENLGLVNSSLEGSLAEPRGFLVKENRGIVRSVYTDGLFASNDEGGGAIVGVNKGLVNNSYSSAEVNLVGTIGTGAGVVFKNTAEGTVQNSFFIGSFSGIGGPAEAVIGTDNGASSDLYVPDSVNYDNADHSTVQPESQMQGATPKCQDTMDLDFKNTWVAKEGAEYPQLSVFVDQKVSSVSNSNAPKGSVWVQDNALHWADGSDEYFLDFQGEAACDVNGDNGGFWVQGSTLRWIDQDGDERIYEGSKVQDSVSGPQGATWFQNGFIHYIDGDGDERRTDGF